MDLTADQIAELQAKAEEAEELRKRLEGLDKNKQQILDEHAKNKQRLKELEEAEKARKQKELEEQGKLQELLEAARRDAEEARKRAEDIEKEKLELAQQTVKQRMRSDFMAGAGAEFHNPEHAWGLFGGTVEDVDGKTRVTYKGSQVSPAEFVKRLRSDADYNYLLKPARKSGMGAAASVGSTPPESGINPFITGNVTQQIKVQVDDPEEAAKLKAEAQAFLAAQAAKR